MFQGKESNLTPPTEVVRRVKIVIRGVDHVRQRMGKFLITLQISSAFKKIGAYQVLR